ncbi:hypothetical protein [Jiangella rhizosphaerae]|uniref:Uncharacterized protein n=1 Tax=Jiangella rhizosphaerae TaxID=2293569 RepID=A0A418KHU2_9ACTN|nr:hypothetical protein [Jiangella rhizosphaerae]RIQ12206.1 hypothetical protein DY240_27490 [Jiangella rhizosphaerae]
MAPFTARAHGYGLVDWTADEVDAYASRLLRDHVAGRRWMPHRSSSCRACGESWPCPAATWAGQWSHGVTRAEPHSRY